MNQSKKRQLISVGLVTGLMLSSGIIFAKVRASESSTSQIEVSSQISSANSTASEALYQLYTIGIPSKTQNSRVEGSFLRLAPKELSLKIDSTFPDSQEILTRKTIAQTAFENIFSFGSTKLKAMFTIAMENTFALIENPDERLLDGGIGRLEITNTVISGSDAVVSLNATLWSELISLDASQNWIHTVPTDDAQVEVKLILDKDFVWQVVDLVVSPNSV